MSLLNFRKKSKKGNAIIDLPKLTFNNDIPNDTDSGISSEYHSPIANSFMMGSSISDITTSSLLDEILNELPSSRKTQISSSSGSETSSTRDIRHSLNLKSNYSSNNSNSIADYNHKKGIIIAPAADGSTIRLPVKENVSRNVGVAVSAVKTHISPSVNTATSTIAPNLLREPHSVYGYESNNNNASSVVSESDSSSIASLSSTEEFLPLHPISRSDPRFHPTIAAGKQEDCVPLIELISRSYATSGGLSKNITKSIVKGGFPPNANNATGLSTIQRSPEFAINRMKERHRQEYRRSLQWTLSVVEQKVLPAPRANSLITNRSSHSTLSLPAQLQQRQPQPHDMMAVNQRVIVVPMINNIGSFNNSMSPKKSFSTNTSANYRQYTSSSINSSEAHSRPLVMMKSIQEDPSTSVAHLKPAIPKVITPQAKKVHCHHANINKHSTTNINVKPESTTFSCCNNNQAISFNCYTHQSCHARHVTQTHHFSGNDPSFIRTKIYSQQKKIFQTANNNNKRAEIDCSQENGMVPKQRAADEEKAAKLDGVLEKRMKMTPKLKTEFRRMQQIYRKKYYSVPNLLQLLDHEEVKESSRKKSLENEADTQSKDIGTDALSFSELSNEKKNLVSAISKTKDNCIEENHHPQQHLHHNSKCRKVIYCCSHHRPHNKVHQHTHNHHQSCCQHQRQAETFCYYQTREKQQNCCSSSHKPRIQQQRKPLSVLTPSELSDTVMTITVVAPSAGAKQQHTQQNFKTCNLQNNDKAHQQLQSPRSRCYSCHHL